ncbi:MAG: LpxD N-terminal domain-containing protein, partial [bacterium]
MIDLDSVARATDGRVDGDGAFTVAALRPLSSAAADSLAFYAGAALAEARAHLRATAAGAVMLRAEHAEFFARHKVIVADPYLAYARASALFASPCAHSHPHQDQVHPSAIVAADASVRGAAIDP